MPKDTIASYLADVLFLVLEILYVDLISVAYLVILSNHIRLVRYLNAWKLSFGK